MLPLRCERSIVVFPDVGGAGKSRNPARVALQRARVPADQEPAVAERNDSGVRSVTSAWKLAPFANAERTTLEVAGDLVERCSLAYPGSALVLASDHEQPLAVVEGHRAVEPSARDRCSRCADRHRCGSRDARVGRDEDPRPHESFGLGARGTRERPQAGAPTAPVGECGAGSLAVTLAPEHPG